MGPASSGYGNGLELGWVSQNSGMARALDLNHWLALTMRRTVQVETDLPNSLGWLKKKKKKEEPSYEENGSIWVELFKLN